MGMPKNELIGKLEKILSLYKTTVAIRSEMDEFVPDDHYPREIIVPAFPGDFQTDEERMVWTDHLDHTGADALEVAEQAHRRFYGPKEPEKPKIKGFEKPVNRELRIKQSKFNGLSQLFAGIAIFFFLGTLLNLNDEYSVLPTLIIITLLAAAAFLLFGYMVKKLKAEEAKKEAEALAAYNRQKEEIMAEHAKKMKVYEGECAEYEDTLKSFLEDYRAWREIFIQSVKEEAQIAGKLEADRKSAVEKIYEERYLPAEAALNECNDLVSEEYLPNLKVIIDLMKSKRADDLKEAINLYEELVYRERQLEQERQAEENRQREAQQQMQMQAQQHAEQMKFQQAQERQRKYEAQQQLRMQEQQHKDEMKMQEARLKQEAAAAKASRQKRCDWCAHKLTCKQQYYDGAYNCTGFTPRR